MGTETVVLCDSKFQTLSLVPTKRYVNAEIEFASFGIVMHLTLLTKRFATHAVCKEIKTKVTKYQFTKN